MTVNLSSYLTIKPLDRHKKEERIKNFPLSVSSLIPKDLIEINITNLSICNCAEIYAPDSCFIHHSKFQLTNLPAAVAVAKNFRTDANTQQLCQIGQKPLPIPAHPPQCER